MPYQYILANLLAKNEDTIAVLFLDEIGETVDLACADFTPYDMKVVGAYLGIYVRQFGEALDRASLGRFEFLHIEIEAIHLYASPLPDGYYLALVQRRPSMVAKARRTLEAACKALAREIFGAK